MVFCNQGALLLRAAEPLDFNAADQLAGGREGLGPGGVFARIEHMSAGKLRGIHLPRRVDQCSCLPRPEDILKWTAGEQGVRLTLDHLLLRRNRPRSSSCRHDGSAIRARRSADVIARSIFQSRTVWYWPSAAT